MSSYVDRRAPIFGFQWHPEKILFTFSPVLAVDHSVHAIVVAQYITNVFMALARQNPNQFLTRKAEENHLIYKHPATYVGNITETPYEQIYLFPFYPENELEKKTKLVFKKV